MTFLQYILKLTDLYQRLRYSNEEHDIDRDMGNLPYCQTSRMIRSSLLANQTPIRILQDVSDWLCTLLRNHYDLLLYSLITLGQSRLNQN